MAGLIQDANKVGGVQQSASKYVAMSTCFDIFYGGASGAVGGTSLPIGFISSLTLGHSRTVTQIRHLNSADAGIAVDTVVTPDVITLQFAGFYVYANSTATKGTITAVTGAKLTGNDVGVGASAGRLADVQLLMTLDQQNIPFDIVVRHSYRTSRADATTNTTGKIIGVYKACTISGMSVPIALSNAAVSDSGTISVGYVASA